MHHILSVKQNFIEEIFFDWDCYHFKTLRGHRQLYRSALIWTLVFSGNLSSPQPGIKVTYRNLLLFSQCFAEFSNRFLENLF